MPRDDEECERILFVEYRDSRPFSVVTDRATYDFEWCKRDGCLYKHDSGSGGGPFPVDERMTYWAAPDAKLVGDYDVDEREYRELPPGPPPGQRLAEAPEGYPLATLLDDTSEGETVYCSKCDDWLPGEDTYHPCDHIRWCDRAGWWSTPDERCPAGCEDCLSDGYPTAALSKPMLLVAEGFGAVGQDWWEDTAKHNDKWHWPYPYGQFERSPWNILLNGIGAASIKWFDSLRCQH